MSCVYNGEAPAVSSVYRGEAPAVSSVYRGKGSSCELCVQREGLQL